jgi:hypothetical protein
VIGRWGERGGESNMVDNSEKNSYGGSGDGRCLVP